MTNPSRSFRLSWYVRRLSRMSPAEVGWRVREQAFRFAWARRQLLPGQLPEGPVPGALSASERRFTAVLPPDALSLVPRSAREAIIADADRILKGEWEILGAVRTDMDAPDWFYDPVTGRRSDPRVYAFGINQRSEEQVGNIKQVWELNRLQHLTMLAAAWYFTGNSAYADCVAAQLRSWWESNPFLSGVNWTSGIELGVRLLNFAWIRRLLDSWPGVSFLFEGNDLGVRQIFWHQSYLAAFSSRGSSANNHLIAEAAGQLAASCAFPWFAESARWRTRSLAVFEESLRSNTFPSGINRELASDYHGFVFELGIFAVLEALIADVPVSTGTWRLLCAMADCMAALVDARCRPPRQGDSDEGRVVLLDTHSLGSWPVLLSLGDALFGRLDWWPEVPAGAAGAFARALAGSSADGCFGALTEANRMADGRPLERPFRFPDAGITILRTSPADSSPEIWCRCDGGPHGFLSIAAHAHADALSVEVRHGGVDILADPGTYCYHGEPEWRKYFQSTIGHNTVEVDGQWQSIRGGSFLWLRHARGRELAVADDGTAGAAGTVATWSAEHDGYARLRPPAVHRRSVRLDAAARSIAIIDEIRGGGHNARLAFHIGPDVQAELEGCVATLTWAEAGRARLTLPDNLRWSLHRAQTNPILGWYSCGLGHRVPSWTLMGSGRWKPDIPFITYIEFAASGFFPGETTAGDSISLARLTTRSRVRHGAIRRHDEPAGAGPAESHPDRAEAQEDFRGRHCSRSPNRGCLRHTETADDVEHGARGDSGTFRAKRAVNCLGWRRCQWYQ